MTESSSSSSRVIPEKTSVIYYMEYGREHGMVNGQIPRKHRINASLQSIVPILFLLSNLFLLYIFHFCPALESYSGSHSSCFIHTLSSCPTLNITISHIHCES